ncbi:MAG TPA: TusE/DsrC/DsvC family sulfur relay protein [Thiobacillaceae bacterium]|nr:TusE/DsrC/DsvC family sulfur relay protein [Thiobacillaceae bacterium]HNU63332.1 TusE/DsrC/DsvC family sulfur relay protein [Thiobacillaceae bacterium]
MNQSTQRIERPGYEFHTDPEFPHAPADWSRDMAEQQARRENLQLTPAHWRVIRALQDYHARQEDGNINFRELHDALDEHFHAEGGIKQLYRLFPQGPVSQGFRLAGLEALAGAQDQSFGSVV